MVDITVVWKDEHGQGSRRPAAQEWVRQMETGKAMDHAWVFAGSRFFKDEETGKEYYIANGGDFISVSNFPSAMLDLPVQSSQDNAQLQFEAFTERIPPRGTPVTMILDAEARAKAAERSRRKQGVPSSRT